MIGTLERMTKVRDHERTKAVHDRHPQLIIPLIQHAYERVDNARRVIGEVHAVREPLDRLDCLLA